VTSLSFDPVLFGEEVQSGLPCVIIAVDFQGVSTLLLYADSDGYLKVAPPEQLRSDWRWDHKLGWYDASVQAEKAVSSEDDGARGRP
jgi:hypothetical protein